MRACIHVCVCVCVCGVRERQCVFAVMNEKRTTFVEVVTTTSDEEESNEKANFNLTPTLLLDEICLPLHSC